jgi:hypothetical protein
MLLGGLQSFAICLLLTGLTLPRPCAALGPPPVITVQPSSITVLFQGTASFYVNASSETSMSYQWLKNGAGISGANSSSYMISGVQTTDAGLYSVQIVNGGGSVTSSAATLTVNVPVTITSQPQNQTVTQGQGATFSVSAGGSTPLGYQWYFNSSAISGATGSSLTLNNVQASQAGSYTVVVSNVAGPVTSSAATLTVNVPVTITSQPQNQTVTQGQGATFSVTAGGTAPLGYQWYFNGSAISGATGSSLTLNNVQAVQAGSYTVVAGNVAGPVTSAVATLTVNLPPSITTQPQSESVVAGGSASFTVAAGGTGTLKYQWYRNGSSVGGSAATYSINNVKMYEAGNYQVVITNNYGSATSAVATLTVNGTLTITNQPQNLTVTQGQSAAFTVTAGGTPPLAYQWYFNNSALSGASSSTLTLTNVQTIQAGSYTVVVSNVVGSVTSAVATLVVYVPPGIVAQPQSQTVAAGQNVSISVAAGGTAPLGCQWYFNGAALAAPTSSTPTSWTLTLSNAQTSIAGTYAAVVTNLAGSITSEAATVTVTNPDIVLSVPSGAGMDTNGFTFQLSVPGGGTYVILASADLQNWTPITTNVATNTTVVFTDAEAANYTSRFYQAAVTIPGS